MNDSDFGTFDRAFRRVCGAFRVRVPKAEMEALSQTYFKVLDAYPLDQVIAVGRTLLERNQKMPFAAEWLAACGEHTRTVTTPDQRQMTRGEIEEYDDARLRHFFADPCQCTDCREASADLPMRFVPTERDDEHYETAWHPLKGETMVIGHWAHGEELRRWYDARARFMQTAKQGTVPLARVFIRSDMPSREPGEEG